MRRVLRISVTVYGEDKGVYEGLARLLCGMHVRFPGLLTIYFSLYDTFSDISFMFTRTSDPLDHMNSLLGFSLFSSAPGILLLYRVLMNLFHSNCALFGFECIARRIL